MPEIPDSETNHPITVMLVDDSEVILVGLRAILGRAKDIKVVGEAENGRDAIALAESLKPDVILMDILMPVMDGIHATGEILRKMPNSKIVILTQKSGDQEILAALAAGAWGYCMKDVEPQRLYTAIRSVYSGDAWLDAAVAGYVLKYHQPHIYSPASNARQFSTAALQRNSDSRATKVVDRIPAEALSPRELEVLQLIVDGLSNQEIADRLIVSLPTAKIHVRNILNKLAVNDRTQAAVRAMRQGLV